MRIDGNLAPRRARIPGLAAVGLAALTLFSAFAGSADAGAGDIPGRGFLPDNRGWEKVSPADKNGFDAFPTSTYSASPDGNIAAWGLSGPSLGASSGNKNPLLLSVRDGSGWSSQPSAAFGLSSDLTLAFVRSLSALTPDAVEGAFNLYARTPSGTNQLLNPGAPVTGSENANLAVLGVSSDGRHFVYHSQDAIPESPSAAPHGPITGTFNPYEWVDGEVRLVSLLPDPDGPGPVLPDPAPHGAVIGSSGQWGSVEHAISADGSRVFFTAFQPDAQPFNASGGQLYVREAGSTTTHVSRSQRTDCAGDPTCGGDGTPDPMPDPEGSLGALYWTAEADHGDKVLFTSCEKLTDDSTATIGLADPSFCSDSGGFHANLSTLLGRDLYIYDVESGDLSDITTGDPAGAKVFGVVGASDDLQTVYFVAGGILDDGATLDRPNLYVWHDGTTRFIATLDSSAVDTGPSSFVGGFGDPGLLFRDAANWALQNDPQKRIAARVTPDGKHLLLTSRASLTGFDNVNPAACPPDPSFSTHVFNPEGRCAEVYLYDLDPDELRCVSCPPVGPAIGSAVLSTEPKGAASATGAAQPSNLSRDGRRAFFHTPQALVPYDSNGKFDVYMWQEGEVHLISSGRGGANSFFSDASPSGDDVFFVTADRLVAADRDDSRDLYDARVDGGFPEPESAPAPCAGEACQGSLPGPPRLLEPGSDGLLGMGNLIPGARASFSFTRLSRSQRIALANGRPARLRVRLNRAGKVTASARAKVGPRMRVVAKASTGARKPGIVRLTLRLSREARRQLRDRGALAVALEVHVVGIRGVRRQSLVLRRTRAGRRSVARVTVNRDTTEIDYARKAR